MSRSRFFYTEKSVIDRKNGMVFQCELKVVHNDNYLIFFFAVRFTLPKINDNYQLDEHFFHVKILFSKDTFEC